MRLPTSLPFLLLSALPLLVSTSPLPLSEADARARADAIPTPTLNIRDAGPKLFTVQGYQSPYPPGAGHLTGYNLVATQTGQVLLQSSTPSNLTVWYTDAMGRAWLNTSPPRPVYVDTANGELWTLPSPSTAQLVNSAMLIPFYHLGEGYGPGAGLFQWIGSGNSDWFACGYNGKKTVFSVFKQMTATNPDVTNCETLQLTALDYPPPGV